jgi:carbohydrate-selective porin OprB
LNFHEVDSSRPGNYRVYAWVNGSDHQELLNPAADSEANYGFGLSLDQELSDGLAAFARYGSQRESLSQIAQAWSVGLQASGAALGREGDTLGIAYGVAIIGDDWEAAESGNWGNEEHLELYYNYQVNDSLAISPNLQWVQNPNGETDNDDVWVFGLRAQLGL